MKKQLLLFVLILLPLVASAGAVEIDGIYYHLDPSTEEAFVTSKPSGRYTGSVVIPSSVTFDKTVYKVTSIEEDAFYNCNTISSVTIGNGVTSIGKHAFYGCFNLRSITLENSVTMIGDAAFEGCSMLNTVNISDLTAWCKINFGDNPLRYAHHLYLNGEEITDLQIPQDVTTIGATFWGCFGLTTVTIGNNITSIGGSAFRNCKNLASVVIGKNVSSIDSWAFLDCNNLTSVTVYISTPLSISSETFPNRANAKLYVPYGCKAAYEAAEYWKEFKEVKEIPSPIINFADSYVKALCVANWDTDSDGELSEAEAASVTDLGIIFKGNKNITSFNEFKYFTGVKTIEKNAFYGCSSLESISFPESINYVGFDAFYGCTNISSLHISELAAWCKINFQDGVSNPLYYTHHLYLNGQLLKDELVIPSTVTAIGTNVLGIVQILLL